MNIPPVSGAPGASPIATASRYDAAADMRDAIQPGSVFEEDRVTTIKLEPSEKERREADYRRTLYHQTIPAYQADTSLNAIDDGVAKLQKALHAERPDLARVSWDFTIKDGELQATGSMTESDKAWLTERLNGSSTLKFAVKTYMKAAVDFLETSAENPAYFGQRLDGGTQWFKFDAVQKQLEGSLRLRELSQATWNLHKKFEGDGYDDPGNSRGWESIHLVAAGLEIGQLD
jgi:hypothetical protein